MHRMLLATYCVEEYQTLDHDVVVRETTHYRSHGLAADPETKATKLIHLHPLNCVVNTVEAYPMEGSASGLSVV